MPAIRAATSTAPARRTAPRSTRSACAIPWRWSFDPPTGELWLGDVGQGAFEEIDLIVRGANYGWDIREGFQCTGGGTNCASTGFTNPVAAYGRSVGFSITGGYVYRGTQTTELAGRYVFGDLRRHDRIADARRRRHVHRHAAGQQRPDTCRRTRPTRRYRRSAEPTTASCSRSTTAAGKSTGLIFNAGGGGGTDNVPQQLSATGCISTAISRVPPLSSSLIPYTVNAPFWSDGATKERGIGLPNGQNIAVPTSGDWEPPNGTVLVKHFRVASQLVETRLFMRHPDGVWAGYTYQWNQAPKPMPRA